jgi:hypothetical protein
MGDGRPRRNPRTRTTHPRTRTPMGRVPCVPCVATQAAIWARSRGCQQSNEQFQGKRGKLQLGLLHGLVCRAGRCLRT